jgi:methionyl-tRNA synthetase
MPETCEKLWEALGAKILGPIGDQKISEVATWGQLPAGVQVSRGDVLFPRLPEPESA